MMAVMIVVGGLLVLAALVDLVACLTAPVGYQDESGFHLGSERSESEERWSGNPS